MVQETKTKPPRTKSYMPQRYVLGLMGFLAVANAYSMRNVLNLTITEMVVHHHSKHDKIIIDPDSCPGTLEIKNHSDPSNEFDWDEKTQGEILGSFYIGYVLTHIPGGLIAERYGGKHVVGYGILTTALLTILTPFAARHSATSLIIVRFIEGLGEGTTFPALNALLAQWAPPLERGRIGSLVFAGNQIGTVFSSVLTGLILEYTQFEWPTVFYIFGGIGVLWFLAWYFLCYDDPASHPFITVEEKDYLRGTIGHIRRNKNLAPVPWSRMALSLPLWGLIIGQIGHDWGLFMIQTDLPKYMKSVLKFSVSQNGLLSSLPFMIMWIVALFSGWLSDYLVQMECFSLTTIRKIFTTVASIGPAAGVVAASYAGCDRTLVVTLFTVGMAFMGFFYPSLKVNALDLSPNYAGTLMAIVNGIGAISGIITPVLVGFIATNSTMMEWREVFWITFAVIIITNIAYIFMGSGEVQSWNDVLLATEEEKMEWEAKKEPIKKYSEESCGMELTFKA
ncbi:putative inorganic phosphate cotransporter [Planococcus citri]|uniref:putative inorganic phosphate cotransporter n=1 Tax=Planococcus citri TaxID=170843 RepID=UPI0031F85780